MPFDELNETLGKDDWDVEPMSAMERIFTVAGTPLVFGSGAGVETGWHLRNAGVKRALALTDPYLAAIGLPDPVLEAIRRPASRSSSSRSAAWNRASNR